MLLSYVLHTQVHIHACMPAYTRVPTHMSMHTYTQKGEREELGEEAVAVNPPAQVTE